MAFDSVRRILDNRELAQEQLAECGVDGLRVEDALMILDGMEQLQRLRENGQARDELLLDELFKQDAVYHPKFQTDDRFAIASCMLRILDKQPGSRKAFTPITQKRKPFVPIFTPQEPQTAVPPAPGVELLTRVAQKKVVGWETDVWFLGPDGKKFVKFWNSMYQHVTTDNILNLEADETITAVLFFSLQAILSCLEDMCGDIDRALEEPGIADLSKQERQASITNILRDIRQPYQDAVQAAVFLPKRLEIFADGFENMLHVCWQSAENLRLASNNMVDLSELEIGLGIASTNRHEFALLTHKLLRAAKAWQLDPALTPQADKHLYDVCKNVMESFQRLNRSAGSLYVPSVSIVTLQGLQMRLSRNIADLQRPFRGTVVQSLGGLRGGALSRFGGGSSQLSTVSISGIDSTIQSWNDLEQWFASLPPTKGGGICFARGKTVLLPMKGLRLDDKWIGGKVEPAETWWDAACREFDEETFVRSDPWVHRIKQTSKKDARVLVVEGDELPWKRMADCPVGSVLIARSNGVQLERDVEKPLSVARMATRDVLASAFSQLSAKDQAKLLKAMRLIVETNGDKSYRTLYFPIDLCMTGRMKSICNIPEMFFNHSADVSTCSQACFADVFADEPIQLNCNAMNAFEQDGFQWVSVEAVGPRIANALQSL